MKKVLFLAFFTTQIISCGMGTIEAEPGATKVTIQNRSTVNLLNVRWNNNNFGNINAGYFSEEKIVLAGSGPVYFEAENGSVYNTCGSSILSVEKYGHRVFPLGSSTPVENSEFPCLTKTLGQINSNEELNAD
jgi:hypothetical protein